MSAESHYYARPKSRPNFFYEHGDRVACRLRRRTEGASAKLAKVCKFVLASNFVLGAAYGGRRLRRHWLKGKAYTELQEGTMFKPLTPEQRVARLVDAEHYINTLVEREVDPAPKFWTRMFTNDRPFFEKYEANFTTCAARAEVIQLAEMLKRTSRAGRTLYNYTWRAEHLNFFIIRFAQSSCKPPPLTQLEQRMLFYASLLSRGVCKLGKDDMKEWRSSLPLAIEGQHLCLDRGDLPVKMTLPNVRALKRIAESEAGREKRRRV